MKITQQTKQAGLFAFSLLFVLFMVSCHRASEKAGEKMMEKAIENATGGKADVDLSNGKSVIETGSGRMEIDAKANKWPSDIPGDIPEFTFGKVKAVTTSNMDNTRSWNVVFEEVQDGCLDKYDALLKEKGFETVIMKMGDKGGSITGESSKYNIFLMGGEGNLSLAITIKKQE
jgi:hypothetical protein